MKQKINPALTRMSETELNERLKHAKPITKDELIKRLVKTKQTTHK